MGPERSKQLHNFTHQPSPLNPLHNSNKRSKPLLSNHNINAVPQKLMIDLPLPATNLKVSIFEERVTADDNSAATAGAVNPRPWNLRTRRAACKAPNREEQRNLDSQVVSKEKKNPERLEKKNQKMMINGRREFCVSLSKEEVEQDFWALVGTKPPRRPKKRPRVVQKQLDTLFPGFWLTEVNADSYKVPDDPE